MKDWPDYDGSVPVPETMTSAAVAPQAAAQPPNYLAMELRQVIRDWPSPLAFARLTRLTEHVEVLGAVSDELTAIPSGLEPEQEIRARAAEIIGSPSQLTVDSVERWRRTVDQVADYIRDGSRPA